MIGITDSLGALFLRGMRLAFKLRVACFCLLIVEPCDNVAMVSFPCHEPKIKPAQGRLNSWLCLTSNSRTNDIDDLLALGRQIKLLNIV